MAFSPDYRTYTGATRAAETAAVLDAGLRAYMLRVYNWMASGLVLTGIVAYAIANTGADRRVLSAGADAARAEVHAPAPLAWIAMFAPLAFVLVLSFGVNRLSTTRGAGALLGVLRGDGRQPDQHLPDLHRREHRPGVLHHRRDVRRDEPVRLHHARPT